MPNAKKITVLVVDDHPLTRIGVCTTVNLQSDMTVIAQAGAFQEAVDAYHRHSPDVILMDLNLPDRNGVETIVAIRRSPSNTKIVVLTTYEGDEDIYQALKAGAQGYVIKGMSHEVLLEAIRTVYDGGQFLPPAVVQTLKTRNPDSILRPREHEVLRRIAGGKSNKEIAGELGITEGTVKLHVTSLLARLGATDRTQATVIALQRGLVHL